MKAAELKIIMPSCSFPDEGRFVSAVATSRAAQIIPNWSGTCPSLSSSCCRRMSGGRHGDGVAAYEAER